MLADILFRLTELERQVANIINNGMVSAVDYTKARAKVKIGEIETDWLPWAVIRAGGDRDWRAPENGEQVTVVSPSGDLAQGIIMFSLYQQIAPAPANNKDVTRTVWGDGLVIEHDRVRKVTTISAIESGGTLVFEGKNLVRRMGEGGYDHTDHAGKAYRITHMGGADFKTDTWDLGSMVTSNPDQGFSPPEVLTTEEV